MFMSCIRRQSCKCPMRMPRLACFAAIILLSPGCGLWANKAVLDAGGTMGDIGEWPREEATFDKQTHLDDEIFRRLYPALRRLRLTDLSLRAVPVTDASIPLIRQLRTLELLALENTEITPEGVQQLKGMPKLRLLILF